MSELPDGPRLEDNLSRLLQNSAKRAELSPDAEARMLAALRTKQVELAKRKEKPMDHPVSLPAQRHDTIYRPLTMVAVSVALLAGFVLLAMMFGPQTDNTPDGPGVATPAQAIFDARDVVRHQLDDGTTVIAHRGSKFTVDAPRRITLDKGEVYLIVAKSKEPFIIKTADGQVTAHGTRLAVSAADQTTTSVAQGRVTLSSSAGKVELRAGQQGVLKKGSRPTRGPAPRLSYLVNWAKDQLGQENRLVTKKEAQEGLIALDPWGQETRLTLRKYQVDVAIEDGIARTTIDQTFFNHYPWNTEGTFYFPLPPDASVSRLAMYVGGRLNEGGMVERSYGQQVYNDIRYQWRDPALLEMMEGNVFKMRIFPLEGRQEKRVFLSYTQKLDELYGNMRYWFPMDHTHSVAKNLSIRVRVKGGAAAYEPQSSTHAFVTSTDGDDLVLEYTAEKIKPDQDLLLNLVPSQPVPQTRIGTLEKDGHQYIFCRVTPDLQAALAGEAAYQPRQWIVLNDISASRASLDAKAQRHILRRLIEEADDDDTLTVVDLNTRAHVVSHQLVSVRSAEASKLSTASSRPGWVLPTLRRASKRPRT